MEVFRELTVTATAEQMATVVDAMDKTMPAGWARAKLAEENVRDLADPSHVKPFYCFTWTGDIPPPATVALVQKSDDAFHVANILPNARRQLSRLEYNGVLEMFVEAVFRPTAEVAGLAFEVTEPQAGLERWMSKATAERLRHFSRSANKGTGSALPADRKRWNAFVLAAHEEGSQLDASTLTRWLIEEEGWASEWAEQLAAEYHYGRELLGFSSTRGGI